MTDYEETFKLEVVNRLARIETKLDSQIEIVKKACTDIVVLQKKTDASETQYNTIKKMCVGTVGSITAILSILVYLKVI